MILIKYLKHDLMIFFKFTINTMKVYITFFLIVVNCFSINSQYTETINSNRPGSSLGSFAVGKDVLQLETGFKNDLVNFDNVQINEQELNYKLRYGFLHENLEFLIKGSIINNNYLKQTENKPKPFLKKTSLGLKYLVYNPFKNKKWYKVNLYSWRANNKIRAVDFIPALSINIGVIFNEKDYLYSLNSNLGLIDLIVNKKSNENFFLSENNEIIRKVILLNEKSISSEINIITQNHFLRNWVLINNFSFEDLNYRISSTNYTLTLINNFNNPKWSAFIEYSKRKNKLFSSDYMSAGIAHLINKNFQININSGKNLINYKNYIYLELGLSHRFDWHEDKLPKNRKEIKLLKKEKKKNTKKTKEDYKLIKKQDKINKRFDRKESRLIKKSNRKNQK